ncbi:MAG: polysaccharide biosynthesis/export family protein [Pseudomonadota bacterium]
MKRRNRNHISTRISAFALAACLAFVAPDAIGQSRYGGVVQTAPTPPTFAPSPTIYQPRIMGMQNGMPKTQRDMWLGTWSRPVMPSPVILGQFQRWMEWEPEYTLVPGDQLDIVVGSAPELSRTLTVGPDGRVVMPMSQPIMAAGRTFAALQTELMAQLGQQLRDPRVSVTPRAYAPEQIFVGGQVGQPGTYTMGSRIGALEAIFMAGGLRPTARTREVAVLRRAPNGGMMLRTVDIKGGLNNIGLYNDTVQLRRGDIVFVPASTLAEVGQWVQNFRNTLPVDFNLSYQFGAGGGNGTTVITP